MMGRLKYKEFDRSMFSYYSGTKNGQDGLSTLLVLPAILTFFNITDLALLIFGLISTSIGFLLIMLSDESWPGAAYGWPLWTLCLTYRWWVEFCKPGNICATLTLSRMGLVGAACRSSMTKLVSPGDIGKSWSMNVQPDSLCLNRQGICILWSDAIFRPPHIHSNHKLHLQGSQQGNIRQQHRWAHQQHDWQWHSWEWLSLWWCWSGVEKGVSSMFILAQMNPNLSGIDLS